MLPTPQRDPFNRTIFTVRMHLVLDCLTHLSDSFQECDESSIFLSVERLEIGIFEAYLLQRQ